MKYDNDVKKDLTGLFEKYVEESLKHIKKTFKYLVPIVEISLVISLCKLLEAMFAAGNFKGLEYTFVFACIWAFGAGFSEKDNREYRKEFSNWWKDKWKSVKFAAKGTVFDYYVDIENTRLEEWNKLNTKDVDSLIDTSKAISSFTVPTVDTISAQFLMKKYIGVGYSPLLVGNAGCGKT
jgi:dynein heavy chain